MRVFGHKLIFPYGNFLDRGYGKVNIAITVSEIPLQMVKDLCGVLGIIFMVYGLYCGLHAYLVRRTYNAEKSLA